MTNKRPRSRSERIPVSNRVLRLEAALEKTGFKRTMFFEKKKTDVRFPRAVKLGTKALGYLETELDAYIDLLAKERA